MKNKKQIWFITCALAAIGIIWSGASFRIETEKVELEISLRPAKYWIKKPEAVRHGYDLKNGQTSVKS